MKTPEEVRRRLSEFAEISSQEDPDVRRVIDCEARLYIFQSTESTSARVGYNEFYRDEVERLTVIGERT